MLLVIALAMSMIYHTGNYARAEITAVGANQIFVLAPDKYPGLDLGVPGMVAGLLWLRTISSYGAHFVNRTLQPSDYDLYGEQVLSIARLDPMQVQAPIFAGSVLAMFGDRIHQAHRILLTSLQGQTGYWELYFWIGYLYLKFYGQADKAADWFSFAGFFPDSPDYLLNLAALIQMDRHGTIDPVMDLMGASEFVAPELRREWQLMQIFQQQKLRLEEQVRSFQTSFGTWPESVTEMVDRGYWSGVPRDPWGGHVRLAADHRTLLPSKKLPIFLPKSGDFLPPPDLESGRIR